MSMTQDELNPTRDTEPITNGQSAVSTLTPPAMRLENVSVSFNGRTAVRDCTFNVASNRVTSLIGPSGSGKTTLLRSLNRLHDLTRSAKVEGKIMLGDIDIYGEYAAQRGTQNDTVNFDGWGGDIGTEPISHNVHLRQCGLGTSLQRY